MTPAQAYSTLRALGVPAVKTADVAAALKVSSTAATKLMTALQRVRLVVRVRSGLWLLASRVDSPYALAEPLTAPLPSYVSLQTALYLHDVIDQVPAVIYVVSLDRSRRIDTTIGTYSVHHMAPELFGGFEERADGTKLATVTKALFDIAYLSGGRTRVFRFLPELELPPTLRLGSFRRWISRIESPRRRSMVEARLQTMLSRASHATATSAAR